MKKIILLISILYLFVSCAKQNAENSVLIQNQFILGEWQSVDMVRAVLTFDNENVKVVIFYDRDNPSVYNYKYKIVGEDKIHIYYSDFYSATNTRVERIEGTVSRDRLELNCKYEKIDKLNLENKTYPVNTDESGLCAFHRFRRL